MATIPVLPTEILIQVLQSFTFSSFEARSETLRRCSLLNLSLRGVAQAELCRHATVTSPELLRRFILALETPQLAKSVESLTVVGRGLTTYPDLPRALTICTSLRELSLKRIREVRMADIVLSKKLLRLTLRRCRTTASDALILPPLPLLKFCEIHRAIFLGNSLPALLNPSTLPALADLSLLSATPELSPLFFRHLSPRLHTLRTRLFADSILKQLGSCTILKDLEVLATALGRSFLQALQKTKIDTLRILVWSLELSEAVTELHKIEQLFRWLMEEGRGNLRRIVWINQQQNAELAGLAQQFYYRLEAESAVIGVELSYEEEDLES